MKTTLSFNTNIEITVHQIADMIRQLSQNERAKLIALLADDEPTKTEILTGLKEAIEEVNLAKQGKMKLKSARAFLHEL
ncbi:hypothetical protein FHS57_002632 [Runella defluvii]|uniref:Uncharacterized protein n=1 Tax=Runella defluvii TaxID=370973 RepID=A0A7W5ZK81_9BACT|nr:hypothetical protein [Runella defluvii]MBB3838626.1 hypothetical protein [Runella defluvii]